MPCMPILRSAPRACAGGLPLTSALHRIAACTRLHCSHPVVALQEYEGAEFLFLRGPENEFEYNYLWCSTQDSYEDHLQEVTEKGQSQEKDAAAGADEGGDGDGDDGDDDDGKGGKGSKKGRMEKGEDGQEKATVKRPVEVMSDIEIATLQVKSHRPPVRMPGQGCVDSVGSRTHARMRRPHPIHGAAR
jgi:hypothetical protein